MRLNKKERETLKKFRIKIEKLLSDNLVEVKLFGSKARGDARKDSDLDVMIIISSGDWRTSDMIYEIATDILIETGVCVSPKVITKKEYNYLHNIGNLFMKNVIREGIAI
ncbi:MAG: hypothetical protein A2Z59_07740 [Nitrospinae bacterium RIFCSPLOWO2_02_39_17]|nr:MAG: hypothetical protein A2Z59_07740 [Nitrospinae bacterium RIFCSPLOWO2_02_39_17]OGW07830.1 MAG: hypothetical protein A2W75_02145 [Nitrospinae bacterium RIFCSPLOWO2_12_39_15]